MSYNFIVTYPARNALNGKFVTRMQYKNWVMPDSMRNTKNASMSLSREDVVSLYALNSVWTALVASVTCCCACLVGVDEADFGTAEEDFAAGMACSRVRY